LKFFDSESSVLIVDALDATATPLMRAHRVTLGWARGGFRADVPME
jgi:hypothetical protein